MARDGARLDEDDRAEVRRRPDAPRLSRRRLGALSTDAARALRALAADHGIQRSYVDALGRRHRASDGVVLATLRTLGVDVDRVADAPRALVASLADRAATLCEPVAVAWDGVGGRLSVRVPEGSEGATVRAEIHLEDGRALHLRSRVDDLPVADRVEAAEPSALERLLPIPPVPLGYHRMSIRIGRGRGEALVIAAPSLAHPAHDGAWGVFLPLYALSTSSTWGAGDLTALGDLIEWVAGLGAEVVATLPLLAAFLEEPFEPSPYSPASRLFWNEMYIDVTVVPELETSRAARDLVASSGFRTDLGRLRQSELVDPRSVMTTKRRVLELCAEGLDGRPPGRRDELERFAAANPRLDDYARFRANVERRRAGWASWPGDERAGRLGSEPAAERSVRYHRYVQWVVQEQLDAVLTRHPEASLLLDLPLGAHPDGYDVWRERGSFAGSVRAGAPPDAVFSGGQDWGFPPLHPRRIREQGYGYVIECIRHLARRAGMLRIDHVMGLHRLYWIPEGTDRADGVYVRYPAEELTAILTLESQRSGTVMVGEDLGTVPRYVRPAMARHRLHRAYVAQYELAGDGARALGHVPHDALASVNTHDMPTFASFWSGRDIDLLRSMGLMDEASAERERDRRAHLRRPLVEYLERRGWLDGPQADVLAVFRGCLRYLGASSAAVVIANLEDLWLEPRPQNVPGTSSEHPNWRRRAALTLEQMRDSSEVRETLEALRRVRETR